MGQNKKNITPENVSEWLASTGFLFPTNEVELERFEKLFGDTDYGLTGKEIDPDKIINGCFREKKSSKIPDDIKTEDIAQFRMAARNGKEIPKNIMDKILKNQRKPKDDNQSS